MKKKRKQKRKSNPRLLSFCGGFSEEKNYSLLFLSLDISYNTTILRQSYTFLVRSDGILGEYERAIDAYFYETHWDQNTHVETKPDLYAAKAYSSRHDFGTQITVATLRQFQLSELIQ